MIIQENGDFKISSFYFNFTIKNNKYYFGHKESKLKKSTIRKIYKNGNDFSDVELFKKFMKLSFDFTSWKFKQDIGKKKLDELLLLQKETDKFHSNINVKDNYSYASLFIEAIGI